MFQCRIGWGEELAAEAEDKGAWVLPDTHAHAEGECPEYVYAVRFSGEELWGEAAEPATSVCVDLFESYLEVA